MSGRTTLSILSALSIATLGAAPLGFAESTGATVKTGPAPDNTGINKRDRTTPLPTADDQDGSEPSVATTRSIRKAIVADEALSTYAHNVKIITEAGRVYLRGPVRSAAEKSRVEELARRAAGATVVQSELEIPAN